MFGTREARRAEVYRQLQSLETAGIPLGTAVAKMSDPQVLEASSALDAGEDPGGAWQKAGFSPLEVALVRAGAKGGELAAAFRDLAAIFEERAGAARRLAAGLLYPVALLHLGVLIPNVVVWFQHGLGAYLKAVSIPLATGWAVLVAAVLLARAARRAMPAVADTILVSLPAIGGLASRRAVARGLSVLGALYRAGVPVRDAVDAAGEASALWPVARAFERVAGRLDAQVPLGDAFLLEAALPRAVREAASTGALTGQLDETLAAAEARLRDEAKMRQAMLLTATPVVVYLLVAAMLGWTIINAYVGEHGIYGKQLNDLLK